MHRLEQKLGQIEDVPKLKMFVFFQIVSYFTIERQKIQSPFQLESDGGLFYK
jgi:hypothetical protein